MRTRHLASQLLTLSRPSTTPAVAAARRLQSLPFSTNPTTPAMSWHANFPATKSSPPEMTVAELAEIKGTPGVDYIVVDARRTDIVGVSVHATQA